MNAITRRRSLMAVSGEEPPHDPIYDNYLVFEVLSDGMIVWKTSNNSLSKTIEYSKNRGDSWTSITPSMGGTAINVTNGDIVCFKGDNSSYANSSYYTSFNGSASVLVGGNINALLGSQTMGGYAFKYLFSGFTYMNISILHPLVLPATVLTAQCYLGMFYNCTSLTTAPTLPAATLAEKCYEYMFQGCTSLTTTPILPATALATYCYHSMFYDCTSLVTALELPAATLATYCYYNMFCNCTSLTTAPELPAKILTTGCYATMFYGCTNINYIKCLATDITATNCVYAWVNGVAASGTFVKDPNMTSWSTGANGIPSGWTVLNA